ncbi:hypothetical protein DM02DRAFT_613923 [Periconia macrospinosa]|uniref:Uncharacterized protein n=1 Tax=Periconia macrospinosa TaxID=97972 RepID=A0A2V1DUX2_9PLEO|nr:hypothetical protein DM02DRAFT_613923 [Periconia macrospinosa]
MIVRISTTAAVALWSVVWSNVVRAQVAPEITVVEEGYNVVAKIPCIGCPFVYQDTSKGENKGWASRHDQNSLLLNISLPYDSAYISINNAPLYSGRQNLPLIHSNQVLSDLSASSLSDIISTGQLDASTQLPTSGGVSFGVSYRISLQDIKLSTSTFTATSPKSSSTPSPPPLKAKLLHLDIFEIHSALTTPPTAYPLDRKEQKILELVLLQTPLLSALSPSPAYILHSAKLIPRPHAIKIPASQQTMHYLSWDAYGRKGTPTHFLSRVAVGFANWISSGFLAILLFVLGVVVLFVGIALVCTFGWGFWRGEYESAQVGKRRRGATLGGGGNGAASNGAGGGWRPRSGTAGRTDLERGRRGTVGASAAAAAGRFLSAEELGLGGRGRVVGVGKTD